MKVSGSDWLLLSPELLLTAAGLLVLSLAVFVDKAKEEFLAFLTLLSVAASMALVLFLSG